MQRILDLGCGMGESWRTWTADVTGRQIIGVDLARDQLRAADARYTDRGWHYICATGSLIPLSDSSVSGVISRVALPYMPIAQVLEELHRVLEPGGWLKMTLHAPAFTWSEFRQSFPKPIPTLFRTFVFLNGMVLHLTGKTIGSGHFVESCQTESGMRTALLRAGFEEIRFRRDNKRFFLEARRERVVHELPLSA